MVSPEGDGTVYEPTPPRGAARWLRLLLEPTSPALVIAGVVLIVTGFVLIAAGWYGVSGTGNVAFQLPYLVSGALAGLGLIVVGVATVAIAVKRQDSDNRIRKLEQLATMLGAHEENSEPGDGPGGDVPNGRRRRSARELLTYPPFRATATYLGVGIVGFVVIVVTWWSVSGTGNVSNQIAYTVSGGVGGLAMAVTGMGLLFAHIGRLAAAQENVALDRVLAATALAADRQAQIAQPSRGRSRRPVRTGRA